MNFIKKNFKHLLVAITSTFFILTLGLGVGLSAFGLGMESQRFINSVEKTIDKYLPKGHIVIDGSKDENLYNMAITKLKEAYETDVLSTLSDEQKNDKAITKFWEDYANDKFEQRWKSVVDNKEDIDINEFSHALVKYDTQIAKKYHNYGFTHSGLQWIGQKGVVSELLHDYHNTKVYQEAEHNQTIINPDDYKNGTYVVNNKLWFINTQIRTLYSLANLPLDLFKDKEAVKSVLTREENGKKVPVQVSLDDFYHPNYTDRFEQTRIGVVFLIILTPIFGVVFIGSIFFSYYFLKNRSAKQSIN